MTDRTPHRRIRLRERRSAACAIVYVLALLTSSCGGGSANAPLPPSPHVVAVHMREYAFGYDRSIAPGRTVFRVRNTGRLRHDLVLIPLPNDFPPIDVQLHSRTRRAIASVAHLPPVRPDRSGTFAVDLTPGRYAMVSFVAEGNRKSDALQGMSSEFRVR